MVLPYTGGRRNIRMSKIFYLIFWKIRRKMKKIKTRKKKSRNNKQKMMILKHLDSIKNSS